MDKKRYWKPSTTSAMLMPKCGGFFVLCLLVWGLLLPVPAAGDSEPLRIGVTPSPPFSFQQDGKWTGISLELWDAVASQLNLAYTIHPTTVENLVAGLGEGRYDIGAAALFTTAERERAMDFSHSFHSGGLSVATQTARRTPWEVFLAVALRPELLGAILLLGLVLLGIGFLAWLAERRHNSAQFPSDPVRGIGNGFWFSAVTMTTVGYGDKAPVTVPGRAISLIWMFASIILISTFTGAIASAFTVTSLTSRIESFDDLYQARVGAVAGSQAAAYLDSAGIRYRTYPDTVTGLASVREGRLDGFVNDAVLLRYLVQDRYPGDLVVLAREFNIGFYALGMQKNTPLRDPVNLQLLEFIQSEAWPQILRRYLGG